MISKLIARLEFPDTMSSHVIPVLFIIIVESVKSTNSLSVVLFIKTPVIPVSDDWLAFTVPISLGILNEYNWTPSAIHLTDTGVDSERVQVNSTLSAGHGSSWLRTSRLISCGNTLHVTEYVPAPRYNIIIM